MILPYRTPTYKSDENKIFAELLMVHQWLRVPSADTANLTGDLQMKTFHSCSGKAVLHCLVTMLDNLLSFLLIRINLALADGRKKATEPPAVLCTEVIQIWNSSSQGTHNMSKAIALLLEIAKAGTFLFLYSYIHIPEKMTHGILLAQQ